MGRCHLTQTVKQSFPHYKQRLSWIFNMKTYFLQKFTQFWIKFCLLSTVFAISWQSSIRYLGIKMVKSLPDFTLLLGWEVIISYSWKWRNLAGDRKFYGDNWRALSPSSLKRWKGSTRLGGTAYSGKGTWMIYVGDKGWMPVCMRRRTSLITLDVLSRYSEG